MRLAQGPGTGPAMLFNNIKDYNKPTSRCRRIFGSALNNNRRIAMMLGLPPDTHARELVKLGRTILQDSDPAAHRQDRPVQGEHRHRQGRRSRRVPGAVLEPARRRPLPHHLCRRRHQGPEHRRDERRHLSRHGRRPRHHPDPDVARPAYRPPRHRVARASGAKEMPIAVAIGWEPSIGFCAGSPVPKGICEYDVMGAIRGEPVDLVKCETNDLYVPASAEIVIEGMLGLEEDDLPDGRARTRSSPAISPATARPSRPSASPPSPIATIRSCAAPSKAACPAAIRRTR